MKELLKVHRSSGMHWVGNGFPVRSVFDYNGLGRELSPFLLLDYAAPYEFPPGSGKRGVGAHPHKGFETVTVVFHGELEHRDSSGGGGKIGPGDVQWMTAGKGIVHEEFHSAEFTRTGGRFHMVQLWVNLRAKDKGAPPGYQTLLKAQIPDVATASGSVRVIAGEYGGRRGAAKTFSPINLWDVTLRAGGAIELPLPEGHTTAILVLSGEVSFGGEGDLAIFGRPGSGVEVKSKKDAKLLVMSGEPFAEPIVGQGPFVMNSRAEIEQAFQEYQQGEMGGAMTPAKFRKLALSLPEAVESAHMDHPDFRVCNKIFATLGPGEEWGMLRLTPDQQTSVLRAMPACAKPASGAWGARGATIVQLKGADAKLVETAMVLAWCNTAPKRLVREWEGEDADGR